MCAIRLQVHDSERGEMLISSEPEGRQVGVQAPVAILSRIFGFCHKTEETMGRG